MTDLENSFEWDAAQQAFKRVSNPIDFGADDSFEGSIIKAGYLLEVSSDPEDDGVTATVKIYATEKRDLPRFYIDVMGHNRQLATLVAKDFLSLLETLKQLQPLLTLIGLDQTASSLILSRLRAESPAPLVGIPTRPRKAI